MDLIILVMQILSFLGGTVFVYLAVFSYEDEDELFQDSLESWWISLRDVEGGLLSKAKLMLTKSSQIVESFLSRLLGEEIFSVRFYSISTVLSFAAGAPLITIFVVPEPWYLPVTLVIVVFLLWQALLPLKTGKPPISVSIILVLLLFAPLLQLFDPNYTDDYEWIFLKLGILSLVSDVLITAFVRLMIRSFGSHFPLIFALLILPVVVVLVGVVVVISVVFLGPFSIMFLVANNMPSVFFAFLIIFIPFMLIIGKPVLNIFGRGLYAVQRHKLIHNKKMLWSISLLLYSTVPFTRPFVDAIKDLGG